MESEATNWSTILAGLLPVFLFIAVFAFLMKRNLGGKRYPEVMEEYLVALKENNDRLGEIRDELKAMREDKHA